MLEAFVRQPGHARKNHCAGLRLCLYCDRYRGLDFVERERRGGLVSDSFSRAAKRLKHGQARAPKSKAVQIGRDLRGRCAVARQDDQAGSVAQMRAHQFDRTGMEPERNGFLKPPAQPRSRPGESRCRRDDEGLRRRNGFGDDRARAVPEWIARTQNHHAPAAMSQQLWNRGGERRNPLKSGLAQRGGQRQMPPPPGDEIGFGEKSARRVRQPAEAVFTDPDDGQPGALRVMASGHDIPPDPTPPAPYPRRDR